MDKERGGNDPVTGIYKSGHRLLRLLLVPSSSFSLSSYVFPLFLFFARSLLAPSSLFLCKTFASSPCCLLAAHSATRRALNSWIPDIFIWTSVGYFYATWIPDRSIFASIRSFIIRFQIHHCFFPGQTGEGVSMGSIDGSPSFEMMHTRAVYAATSRWIDMDPSATDNNSVFSSTRVSFVIYSCHVCKGF